MYSFMAEKSPWMLLEMEKLVRNFFSNVKDYPMAFDDDAFKVFNGLDGTVREFVDSKLKDSQYVKSNYLRWYGSDDDPASMEYILYKLWREKSTRKAVADRLVPMLIDRKFRDGRKNAEKGGRDEFKELKIDELKSMLHLSDVDVDILMALFITEQNWMHIPFDVGSYTSKCYFLSYATGISRETLVAEHLAPGRPLVKYGCVFVSYSDVEISGTMTRFLCGMSEDSLASSFYSKLSSSDPLPYEYFSHLNSKHGSVLERMLSRNAARPARILLYGAPGTGKTSYAEALARHVGRKGYSIVPITANDGSMDKKTMNQMQFRFNACLVCDSQVPSEGSVIVVDEADELLRCSASTGQFLMPGGHGNANAGNKSVLNMVLDDVKTPMVWITNIGPNEMDESSRRRFDYSIKFERLDGGQRRMIWENTLGKLGMKKMFTRKQVEEFASKYPVSAGGIAMVLENVKSMGVEKKEAPDMVDRLMGPHCELMGVKPDGGVVLPSKDYSLDGLNIRGDVSLEDVIGAIRRFQEEDGGKDPDRPRMNLLLSGPPGTGKTEFVKYLGSVLDTKVNVRMGSDILSMWVGGSEQNIARAFREAEAERAILFLDEIDGLMQSRERAFRNWEVTQVNELLYQMENFKGVMIGATNFCKNLDQAVMRRFTFKLEFDYLDDEGRRKFFERMLKSRLTDDEFRRLCRIDRLSPGDFRTVRQGAYYLGGRRTNAYYLDALEREAAARSANGRGGASRMGF